MPSSDDDGRERRDQDAQQAGVPQHRGPNEGPSDVFLDVPALHVDELDLEVDDLEAHVSLQAEVLDLLKLNVGADVRLGRVELDIEGVDVQAQLRVRLHNIVAVVTRLLTTVDRNPEVLEQLTRGVGAAAEGVGAGAGRAVGQLGEGAGAAVKDAGRGAGAAVEGAGSAVREIGDGARSTVEDVGRRGAEAVGEGAADAVGAVAEDGESEDERPERPPARRPRKETERRSARRTGTGHTGGSGRKKAAEADGTPKRAAPARKAAAKGASARKAAKTKPTARKRGAAPGRSTDKEARSTADRPRRRA
ncbi:hypothetical protein [Streptomyces sp. NPDC056796]|uniref:hypothetical protein n=1 Tax=Streptomyces sp. NPDC056796 TaxID=3345947 RepID=UPI00368F4FAC